LCFTYQKQDGSWENSNIDTHQALDGYAHYVSIYTANVLKHVPVTSLQKTFLPYSPPNRKEKKSKD